MILPLRVFGQLRREENLVRPGDGTDLFRHVSFSSSIRAIVPSTPALSETKAQIAWPLISWVCR